MEIDICDADGTVRSTATFACHPEFAEFGQCQAMTTGELVSAIKERIDKVFAEQCAEASAGGSRWVVESTRRMTSGMPVTPWLVSHFRSDESPIVGPLSAPLQIT